MAILTRIKENPQERFDLEEFLAMHAALRTDSKLHTQKFLSSLNFILGGLAVSGIGLKSATVAMTNAALIIPQNTTDFSYFVSSPSEPDIIVPESSLVAGARNYVEISLVTQDSTPLTKAFWDPEANSGAGAEFNQIVNTVTDLQMVIVTSTGGFSGSPDRLKLAIVDTDGSGNITGILDKRNLFFRLGQPGTPLQGYTWASQTEPSLILTLSGVSGTYVAGETVTLSSGATAQVIVGGTGPTIGVILPSSDLISAGASVTGGTSGATGSLVSFLDNFLGADKSIVNARDLNAALQSEIRAVKGTPFWFSQPIGSLAGLFGLLNSVVSPLTSGARISWDGTNLKITDDAVSPSSSDHIGAIRVFNSSANIRLNRQDGTGGSAVIPIPANSVLWVQLPSPLASADFTGIGSGALNFRVSTRGSVPLGDSTYWLAYREGSKVIFRGIGELEPGEDIEFGDGISNELLVLLGGTTLPITEATSDAAWVSRGAPLRFLESDDSILDAVANLESDTDKFLGQFQLKELPSNRKRIIVTGANFTMRLGNGVGSSQNNLVALFPGAQIDFSTGIVYAPDGLTPIDNAFTPATIAAGQFRYYSITAQGGTVDGLNRQTIVLTIQPAAGDGSSPTTAPYPSFPIVGRQLGYVYVQQSGGDIANIFEGNITQFPFIQEIPSSSVPFDVNTILTDADGDVVVDLVSGNVVVSG